METVGKIINSQLRKKSESLPASFTSTLVVSESGTNELSTYIGKVLDAPTVISEVSKIKVAFPSLSTQFMDILIERAIAKNFTAQRLIDAVNFVIDNCQYPSPTLANFLGFDRRIKILSYDELCDLVTTNRASFESYSIMVINGKNFWVRNADKELYNLPEQI